MDPIYRDAYVASLIYTDYRMIDPGNDLPSVVPCAPVACGSFHGNIFGPQNVAMI